MISILQINNDKTSPTSYKLGLLPITPVKPLSYPATKNFSMCRFPNTKWNARVYYGQFKNCNCRLNQCDKYLFKI